MRAIVSEIRNLPNLPSASGVEKVGDRIFIVGNDSRFLYSLDGAQDRDQVLLLEGANFGPDRIPKKLKPDFEGMAHLSVEDGSELLIFGSGSKPELRDKLLRVTLTKDLKGVEEIREYSLAALYAELRRNREVVGEGMLESLTVAAGVTGKSCEVVAVTDDDKGGSTLVTL